MKPEEWKWRKLLLAFDCGIAFGAYYNYDVPSTLQADLQGEQNACTNGTTNGTFCEECLGLGPYRYNNLYAAFAWMNAVCALPGGFLIDRLGNRVGGLIFSALIAIGSLIFTVATLPGIRRTSTMFPLMILGRLLLGAGTGTCLMELLLFSISPEDELLTTKLLQQGYTKPRLKSTFRKFFGRQHDIVGVYEKSASVIQQRVVSFWFQDKITIAIGFTILSLRIASVSNFLITANVHKAFGITPALWIGSCAGFIGFLSAIGFFVMDYIGMQHVDIGLKSNSNLVPFNIKDLGRFPRTYWLICATITTFYSSFIPFISNGSKYIQDRYGYSRVEASYVMGAIFDVGIVFSPLGGIIFTKINVNGLSLLVTLILMVPVYPLLYYCASIPPLIWTIVIGICCVTGALFLWPFLMKVVPIENYGLASGLASFFEGLGIGMTNLAIGKILGTVEDPDILKRMIRYLHMTLVLLSMSCASVLLVVIINIIDLKGERKFNERLAKQKEEMSPLLRNSVQD